MSPLAIIAAVVREVVPPPHVRQWLVEAAMLSAADLDRVREAALVLVVAVAVLALLLGRSS